MIGGNGLKKEATESKKNVLLRAQQSWRGAKKALFASDRTIDDP